MLPNIHNIYSAALLAFLPQLSLQSQRSRWADSSFRNIALGSTNCVQEHRQNAHKHSVFKHSWIHILCLCVQFSTFDHSIISKDATYLALLMARVVQVILVLLAVRLETLLPFPSLLSHHRLPSGPSLHEALQGSGLNCTNSGMHVKKRI